LPPIFLLVFLLGATPPLPGVSSGRLKPGGKEGAAFAVVERGPSTAVRRGENAGRSLRHENVVRVFETIHLDSGASGETEMTLPAPLVRAPGAVIGFVQNPQTMAILGAAGADLTP